MLSIWYKIKLVVTEIFSSIWDYLLFQLFINDKEFMTITNSNLFFAYLTFFTYFYLEGYFLINVYL